MALVKCVDCENEVSTSAVSCPKCGAPGPAVAAMQQAHQRLKPHYLGAATAISLGMLGMVGMMLDIVPIDGDAGIFFTIVVSSLIMGGALWALVTIFRISRPHS